MPIVKLGLVAAITVAAALGLIWATEIVPRTELPGIAAAAFGGLLVLIVAGFALRQVRAGQIAPDKTDRPVP